VSPVLVLGLLLATASAPAASPPRAAAAPDNAEDADEVSVMTSLTQAATLVAAGALGPGLAGGVMATALVAAAFSSSNGLVITPLLLISVGLFAMLALPVGFVFTAAALSHTPLSRAIGGAAAAPVGGLVGAFAGGGAGLVTALIAVQVAYPEQQLQGDLLTSLSTLGALAVVALGAGLGAAVGGGLGGGLGAAGGYAAGMGAQMLLPRRRADDGVPLAGENE
jgi:hypothetical protein